MGYNQIAIGLHVLLDLTTYVLAGTYLIFTHIYNKEWKFYVKIKAQYLILGYLRLYCEILNTF
jgi:4-hydroxybenzoate polyprenyltransferase